MSRSPSLIWCADSANGLKCVLGHRTWAWSGTQTGVSSQRGVAWPGIVLCTTHLLVHGDTCLGRRRPIRRNLHTVRQVTPRPGEHLASRVPRANPAAAPHCRRRARGTPSRKPRRRSRPRRAPRKRSALRAAPLVKTSPNRRRPPARPRRIPRVPAPSRRSPTGSTTRRASTRRPPRGIAIPGARRAARPRVSAKGANHRRTRSGRQRARNGPFRGRSDMLLRVNVTMVRNPRAGCANQRCPGVSSGRHRRSWPRRGRSPRAAVGATERATRRKIEDASV